MVVLLLLLLSSTTNKLVRKTSLKDVIIYTMGKRQMLVLVAQRMHEGLWLKWDIGCSSTQCWRSTNTKWILAIREANAVLHQSSEGVARHFSLGFRGIFNVLELEKDKCKHAMRSGDTHLNKTHRSRSLLSKGKLTIAWPL